MSSFLARFTKRFRSTAVRSLVPALLLAGSLLLPFAANAQQTAARKPTAKKPAAKPAATLTAPSGPITAAGPVTPFAGNTSREFTINYKGFNEKSMTYNGEVTITSLETQLKSDTVVFDRKAQTATSAGKVQFDDVQQTLMGDKGAADYKVQEAKVEGSVTLMLRATPEAGKKDFGTLTSDTVTYNWKERTATASGNATLKLKDKTVTADKIVYFGKDEKIELVGNVVITLESGDKMTCGKATLMLKDGAEDMTLEEGQTATLKVSDGTP